MQNYPNQLTHAMCNRPDGLVVPQPPHQTMIHNLEGASFPLDGSIRALIENAAHLPVTFADGKDDICEDDQHLKKALASISISWLSWRQPPLETV